MASWKYDSYGMIFGAAKINLKTRLGMNAHKINEIFRDHVIIL